MVHLEIDHKKGLPIYLQIIEQIKHHIAAGRLSVGDQLPTVRSLAISLEVNPNTVAKAYTEMERTGILETRQGIGTFVKKSEDVLDDRERADKLRSIASSFVDEALWFGYSSDEIVSVVNMLVSEKTLKKKSQK